MSAYWPKCPEHYRIPGIWAGELPVSAPVYTLAPAETIDLIEALGLQSNLYRASALQYLIRAGRKGDPAPDLRKAISYLGRELERLEGSTPLPDYSGENLSPGGTD